VGSIPAEGMVYSTAILGYILQVNVEEEIGELKELVEKNIEVTEETNRVVHKMRRSAMWGMVMQIVWWVAIAGATGAAYYYYVQPYVAQIQRLYGASQTQSQNLNEQIVNFVKFLGQQDTHSSTTTPR